MTKELRKAVMKTARLRNVYLKKRTGATKPTYNYQRNICVSLLRKWKRSYFENLNIKIVRNNKIFWKKVAPLFSNKIKSKETEKLIISFQTIKKLLRPSTNSLVTL